MFAAARRQLAVERDVAVVAASALTPLHTPHIQRAPRAAGSLDCPRTVPLWRSARRIIPHAAFSLSIDTCRTAVVCGDLGLLAGALDLVRTGAANGV